MTTPYAPFSESSRGGLLYRTTKSFTSFYVFPESEVL